jgi:hypothetical protein
VQKKRDLEISVVEKESRSIPLGKKKMSLAESRR